MRPGVSLISKCLCHKFLTSINMIYNQRKNSSATNKHKQSIVKRSLWSPKKKNKKNHQKTKKNK